MTLDQFLKEIRRTESAVGLESVLIDPAEEKEVPESLFSFQTMARAGIEPGLGEVKVVVALTEPADYEELVAAGEVMARLESKDRRILRNVLTVMPADADAENPVYFAGYIAGFCTEDDKRQVTYLLHPAEVGVFELDAAALPDET